MPEYPADAPTISVWVTVTHRKYVLKCLPSFLARCTYPNTELLICHEGHPETTPFLEAVSHPRKQMFVGPRPLAAKYRMLRERSAGAFWYSIQDDWLYLSDPGPMMRDAAALMAEMADVCMVRMTCHTPVFLDVVHPYIQFRPSSVGPVAFRIGLADMQTVIRPQVFEALPDLWPDDMDFYAADGYWQDRIRALHMESAAMLRYWGCNIHAGTVGDSGRQTEENLLNEREGGLIRESGMFGSRPEVSLYTGWLSEEQRREFLYPLFIQGFSTLVPNPVPVTAQARLGPSAGRRVA